MENNWRAQVIETTTRETIIDEEFNDERTAQAYLLDYMEGLIELGELDNYYCIINHTEKISFN